MKKIKNNTDTPPQKQRF